MGKIFKFKILYFLLQNWKLHQILDWEHIIFYILANFLFSHFWPQNISQSSNSVLTLNTSIIMEPGENAKKTPVEKGNPLVCKI